MRTYSDEQLAAAVEESRSWSGTLRSLGLRGTSAGSLRSVRARAEQLGIDYTHFTGQRRWSDRQLATAVAENFNWADVAIALGLAAGRSTTMLKGHALRLGIDTQHLDLKRAEGPRTLPTRPLRSNLARAGSLLAAAWFELTGHEVCWPLEPCRYDLMVSRSGLTQRVQVKTTTNQVGSSWAVGLRCTASRRGPYDPADIDQFFVIDGNLQCFLIPIQAVGGRVGITLSAYEAFRLPTFAFTEGDSRNQ
jgi:hypothetical protein